MLVILLLTLLLVSHVSATTPDLTSVSFQMLGWFDSTMNTESNFYGEMVRISYQVSGSTDWINATTDWIQLVNYQRTNYSFTSQGNAKIMKLRFTAANIGSITLSGASYSRWFSINDHNFVFNGNLVLYEPGSIMSMAITANGDYDMDLSSLYSGGIPAAFNQTGMGLSESNCYDTTKKYICYRIKGKTGPGDDQEKISMYVFYTDGSNNMYYRYYLLPNSYYDLLMVDTTKHPTTGAAITKTVDYVHIVYHNDDNWTYMNIGRDVFLDVNNHYVFGAKAISSELTIRTVSNPNPTVAQMAILANGTMPWGTWYKLVYRPNACSSSGFPSWSSHRLCLRVKSSSTISNSSISLSYTNTSAPSTPVTQSISVNNTLTDIAIDLSSGNLTNVKLSVDPTQTSFIIDMGATKHNGTFVKANDQCILNNGTTITTLLNLDFS